MRSRKQIAFSILIIGSQIFIACSEDSSTEPKPWTGAVTLACHMWQPQKPEAPRIIADVALGPEDPNGPTATQLQELKAHGATILHSFNIPMARVDMPVDSVAALEQSGSIAFATGVSFPNQYEVHGLVMGFTRPIEQADFAFLNSKGVQIEEHFGNTLIITVEDDSIPSIRSPDNQWFLELNYFFCGAQPTAFAPGRSSARY